MKKWIGLLLVLSVFIFSIKPSYARFVDKKEKTLSSVKLSSPTETIDVTPSVSDVDFNQNPTKTATFSLDIVNNSTLTINKLEITSADGEWSKYYRLDFSDTNISDTNPLVPVKKEGSSESTYKRTINGTITNFQIPSEEISINIKLVFTSVGGKSVEKWVTLSVKPKTINYTEGLTITGDQEINFSTTSEDILSTTWTIKGASTKHLVTIEGIATVENALSPLNSVTKQTADNKNMQETDWKQYFKVTTSGVTDNQFTITVDRTSKALSYKELKVWITVTGTNPDGTTVSYTKSVNITPILDRSGTHTVAWPLNKQFDSQNIYFTPVYYGSNENGKARTVFPMARFYKTNKEVANINSIQPEHFPDGENYNLQKIYSLGDTYINNRGYLTYYAMIYGMNSYPNYELYNDFGGISSHYRVLKYDFTTNEFYDKFPSVGIGTRFDEYMNFIKPDLFINTTYQLYNHKVFYKDKSFKVFVTRLDVDFPRVYDWNGKRSLEYVFPHKTMSQGDIVFDTYYVGE